MLSSGHGFQQIVSQLANFPVFSYTKSQLNHGLHLTDTGLIMYIVVRRDLWKDLGWPLGSVITQVKQILPLKSLPFCEMQTRIGFTLFDSKTYLLKFLHCYFLLNTSNLREVMQCLLP